MKRPCDILHELGELNPEAQFVTGFNEALVGIGRQFNRYLAIYDTKKCLAILAEGLPDTLDADEKEEVALEYFEFNIVGAWVGENTPIFLLQGEDS